MPDEMTVQTGRKWFSRAAQLWVDMERGIYNWGENKPPRHRDGSYRVVKAQILKDLGLTTDYHNAKERIWENPTFLECVKRECQRRDHGIVDVIHEIEAVSGPISGIGNRIVELLQERLRDGNEEELSTKELLQYGPGWVKLGLELEGKLESQKEAGIEYVLGKVAQKDQVTNNMLDSALSLVKEYRMLQDRKLENMGLRDADNMNEFLETLDVVEGELEDE